MVPVRGHMTTSIVPDAEGFYDTIVVKTRNKNAQSLQPSHTQRNKRKMVNLNADDSHTTILSPSPKRAKVETGPLATVSPSVANVKGTIASSKAVGPITLQSVPLPTTRPVKGTNKGRIPSVFSGWFTHGFYKEDTKVHEMVVSKQPSSDHVVPVSAGGEDAPQISPLVRGTITASTLDVSQRPSPFQPPLDKRSLSPTITPSPRILPKLLLDALASPPLCTTPASLSRGSSPATSPDLPTPTFRTPEPGAPDAGKDSTTPCISSPCNQQVLSAARKRSSRGTGAGPARQAKKLKAEAASSQGSSRTFNLRDRNSIGQPSPASETTRLTPLQNIPSKGFRTAPVPKLYMDSGYAVPASQMPVPIDLANQTRKLGGYWGKRRSEVEREEEQGMRVPGSYHSVVMEEPLLISVVRKIYAEDGEDCIDDDGMLDTIVVAMEVEVTRSRSNSKWKPWNGGKELSELAKPIKTPRSTETTWPKDLFMFHDEWHPDLRIPSIIGLDGVPGKDTIKFVNAENLMSGLQLILDAAGAVGAIEAMVMLKSGKVTT